MKQSVRYYLPRIQWAVACGLILSILLSFCGFSARCDRIRERVFRLHILAHSDSAEDQACKLAVRDRLLQESGSLLAAAHSQSEAKELALEYLPFLQSVAQEEVYRQGKEYGVRLEVAPCHFNTRVYEEVTLPAGEYPALRVILGEGTGQNWWCVMFPPMCLPSAGETETLSEVLEAEDVDIVSGGSRYEIKFKAVEWMESISRKFKEWFKE